MERWNGVRRAACGIRFGLLLLLLCVVSPTFARSQETPAQPGADTVNLLDVRARVMAFTAALDSVYTSIAGTYRGIEPILRRGCYDCHSGQTRFPWYHKIPGIRGMIDQDIAGARKHVDMDKGFPFGGRHTPQDQLRGIREEIAEGGMPPFSYRLMHWGAKPSDAARDSVFAWIDSSLAAIQQTMSAFGVVPPDATARVEYYCPMDADVVSAKPGTCPKCGMDLEERRRESEEE